MASLPDLWPLCFHPCHLGLLFPLIPGIPQSCHFEPTSAPPLTSLLTHFLPVSVAPENPVVEVQEQAVEGGEVELSCLVPRSRPVAVLRWYRDRKELKGIPGSGVRGVGEVPVRGGT